MRRASPFTTQLFFVSRGIKFAFVCVLGVKSRFDLLPHLEDLGRCAHSQLPTHMICLVPLLPWLIKITRNA